MTDALGPAGQSVHGAGGVSVAEVVHDVIAEVAPNELVLVEGLRRIGSDNVIRRLTDRNRPREPLGFGSGEIAVLTTPVVWIAVDEAVRRGVDGTGARLWGRLRRIAHRPSSPPVICPLTREQLELVRKRVLELAAKEGMARAKAEVLADRVVARLAIDPGMKGGAAS